MARWEVKDPSGRRWEITAPDGATEEEVRAKAQEQWQAPRAPDVMDTPSPDPVSRMVGLTRRQGQGVADSIRQGLMLGFADEIGGAAASVGSALGLRPQTTYGEDVAQTLRRLDKFRQENPVMALGSEIAGSVPTAMAALPARLASAGASLTARMLQGAKAAAPTGAVYGAGATAPEGVPDLAGTPQESSMLDAAWQRAKGAAVGGAVSAGIGGAIPPVAAVGKGVYDTIANPLRATFAPKGTAELKVAEALMRDAGGGAAVYRRPAMKSSQKTVSRDPRAFLVDAHGENTQNLMRSALNIPNEKSKPFLSALRGRQDAQGGDIVRKMGESLGTRKGFEETVDAVIERQKTEAAKDYSRAWAMPWKVKAADPFVDFLQRPFMARIVENMERNVGGMTGKSPMADGPWQLLHRVKMQIDREISSLKRGNPDSKANWDLNDLYALQREFLGHMRRLNPSYGVANAKFAGDEALKEAAADGAEAWKLSPREIGKTLSKMSPSEVQLYRRGALDELAATRIMRGNPQRDRVAGVLADKELRAKLRALYPDAKSYREAERYIGVKGAQARTLKAATGNSTTAKQLLSAQDSAEPAEALKAASGVAGNLAAGRPIAAIGSMLQPVVNRFRGMSPEVAAEVLRLLGPSAVNKSGAALGAGKTLPAMVPQPMARAVANSKVRNAASKSAEQLISAARRDARIAAELEAAARQVLAPQAGGQSVR